MAAATEHPQLHAQLLDKAAQGHTKDIFTLISKKANVNCRGEDNVTPLHMATCTAMYDAAQCLIQQKADPNMIDSSGITPLHLASMIDTPEGPAGKLSGRDVVPEPAGAIKFAKLLISGRANPKVTDNDGATPLHFASAGGQLGCVRLLLSQRADPNVKDKGGKRPYDVVCHGTAMVATKEAIQDALVDALAQSPSIEPRRRLSSAASGAASPASASAGTRTPRTSLVGSPSPSVRRHAPPGGMSTLELSSGVGLTSEGGAGSVGGRSTARSVDSEGTGTWMTPRSAILTNDDEVSMQSRTPPFLSCDDVTALDLSDDEADVSEHVQDHPSRGIRSPSVQRRLH